MTPVKVYRNTGFVFLILFAFVMVGFYKTYFGLIPQFNSNITYVTHIHFFFLMTWVLLLVVQPLLIRYKKYQAHKIAGKLTYVIAPGIVASLISLMFKHYYEADMSNMSRWNIFVTFYFQGIHTMAFSIFYILALRYKRDSYLHATYMIATGIVFIKPSLTRVVLHTTDMNYIIAETLVILFIDLVILTLVFYVRSKQLNYRPYLLVLAILLFYHIPAVIKLWSEREM